MKTSKISKAALSIAAILSTGAITQQQASADSKVIDLNQLIAEHANANNNQVQESGNAITISPSKYKVIDLNSLIIDKMVSEGNVVNIPAGANQQQFITAIAPAAQQIANQYGLYPSVLIAQALIESEYGQSGLSQNANNLFGMKGSYNGQSISLPTGEYVDGQYVTVQANFRRYPNVAASMLDYANLLVNGLTFQADNYNGTWRSNAPTADDAVYGLIDAKYPYATSPVYADTIIKTMQTYDLYRFD